MKPKFLRGALILFALSLLALGGSLAQTALNPQPVIATCAYNSSPPTASTSGFILLQCNSSGQVVLH